MLFLRTVRVGESRLSAPDIKYLLNKFGGLVFSPRNMSYVNVYGKMLKYMVEMIHPKLE